MTDLSTNDIEHISSLPLSLSLVPFRAPLSARVLRANSTCLPGDAIWWVSAEVIYHGLVLLLLVKGNVACMQ